MPAPGESQMLAGVLAFDVERVGVGEHSRIAVGRGDVHDDQFALTDRVARYLGVVQRHPGGELNRRLQPQDLLDGVGPQLADAD